MDQGINLKKNIVFNTWGVFFYFFCQWVLTIIVTRVKGYEAAGQYSLAVSFTNIFSFIAMFGVRGLQISDVEHAFTDGQYYALRAVTSVVAVILFAVVLPLRRYSEAIVWCCVAMMLFKLMESLYDVTIGTMQRNESFFQVAASYTLRGIFPAAAFVVVLVLGASVPWAILVMTVAMLGSFAAYDIPQIKHAAADERKFRLDGTLQIVRESFPLMLTALLDSALVYIPRDAVEKFLGAEPLGYYSAVSIVVVVLSTLGSAVWGSIMPQISRVFAEKNWSMLHKTLRMTGLYMAGGSVLVLIFGNLLGPFFFGLIFGSEILSYMYLLMPVLVNAVLLLVNSFFQCIFIPIKKRNVLLVTNGAAVGTCLVFCNILVREYGLLGACFGLMVGLTLRAILLVLTCGYSLYKMEKEDNSQ